MLQCHKIIKMKKRIFLTLIIFFIFSTFSFSEDIMLKQYGNYIADYAASALRKNLDLSVDDRTEISNILEKEFTKRGTLQMAEKISNYISHASNFYRDYVLEEGDFWSALLVGLSGTILNGDKKYSYTKTEFVFSIDSGEVLFSSKPLEEYCKEYGSIISTEIITIYAETEEQNQFTKSIEDILGFSHKTASELSIIIYQNE